MSRAGTDINNANTNNIIRTIKNTKLYVCVVTLSVRDNQRLWKFLSNKRWVYWNEYKTKSESEDTTNEHRYFLESNFVGINILFVLVYSNENNSSKKFKTQK